MKKGRKALTALLAVIMGVALLATAVTPAVFADSADPMGDALAYLADIQSASDGSIGSYSDSAWAVMAIAAAGEDPHEWTKDGGPSAVDFLKDSGAQQALEYNPVSGLARVALAAVAACEDPSAFGAGDPTAVPDGDYVAKLKEYHNGTQFVYETTDWYTGETYTEEGTLNEDFWAVMALIAAGEPQDSALITSTVQFILDNQGEDGGWSWATFDNPSYWESDVDNTAAGIMACIAAGMDTGCDEIGWALDYLGDNQDASGGFASWGVVNASSTTWAIDAIVAAGQDPTSPDWTKDANPVDFLLTLQGPKDAIPPDTPEVPAGAFIYAYPLPSGYLAMLEKNTADAIVSLSGTPYPVKIREVYTFEDTWNGSLLTINPDCNTFRFIADGYDSGTVQAHRMTVKWGRVTINHRDRDLYLVARANTQHDFCVAIAIDRSTWKWNTYTLFDPWGEE
ncbi:MAG: prenyltransferase/squalene oxidase repeat-containing protein [Chloroflexota bacterium]|nr:prenyltransferase/squalene oxidase repeat-containing protein [Chloroflexota bacterium]